MKPNLIIGLGNPLMGDDGIGWCVAARLATDRRLPEDTEVLAGGTDLLGYEDRLEGRRHVVLIDALLGGSTPGEVTVYHDDFRELEQDRQHAHYVSAPASIALLRTVSPALSATRFTLVAVAIASARMRRELSPALEAKLPAVLDRVLGELRG